MHRLCASPLCTPNGKTGRGYAFGKGQRVNYNNVLYNVLSAHDKQTQWTPEAAPSLFAKVLIPDPGVIPDWEQPSSTNGYKKATR